MESKLLTVLKYLESRNVPLRVEVSNICSARCSFCAYGKGVDWRKPGYIKEEFLDRILFLLEEHYSRFRGNITLGSSHGDVLTCKSLLYIIKKITAIRNISGVSFYTNAVLLHKFNIEELIDLNITTINISTAIGSSEQFKRLFGTDCYDKTFNNIVELISCNNSKKNKVDINILLRVDKPFEKVKETDDYKTIEKYVGADKIEFSEDWDDWNGIITLDQLPIGHSFESGRPVGIVPCYALYRKLEILIDGYVNTCTCRLSKELNVGNIFEAKTISEIWEGDELRSLRENWLSGNTPKICITCSHYIPATVLYKGIKRKRNIYYKALSRLNHIMKRS